MKWLDTQVSLYCCNADNTGEQTTLRDVLQTRFAIRHRYFYKRKKEDPWTSGEANDFDTICDLRNGSITDKLMAKATLQCFTPAALLKSKKKGAVTLIKYTGLMQLDFDSQALIYYDIEEAKQAVFSLDCVAFCSRSCSGTGFYALIAIAEPERLEEYAEHLFEIFKSYGLVADTSKGSNVQDLRYVSYDANMLIREEVTPLKIKRFRKKQSKVLTTAGEQSADLSAYIENKTIHTCLSRISSATIGQRWPTVQQAAYTLGGLGDRSLLSAIKDQIRNNSAFSGEIEKYIECAEVCFEDGIMKPLKTNII